MVRNVAMAGGPGRRTRRVVAGSLTTLALLPACASTHPSATPQATVPVTSATADPYAVPAKITPAYVQRVLDALDSVDGAATREIVSERRLTKHALDQLRAIDSDRWFTEVTDTWADELAKGLPGYRSNSGVQRDTVTDLISEAPKCIFASVMSDYSEISTQSSAPQRNYIVLRPLPSGRDTSGVNPTPWLVDLEGYNSAGLQPADPCAAAA